MGAPFSYSSSLQDLDEVKLFCYFRYSWADRVLLMANHIPLPAREICSIYNAFDRHLRRTERNFASASLS